MARRTFFSFHYKPDVQRAMNVRNSWVTKQDRADAGFFDSSVFESKERTSPDALKRFLSDGLSGCSVTAVLYGTETATRRWVRFELLKSFLEGKGILSIAIHTIANLSGQTARPGPDPLSWLGVEVSGGLAKPKEFVGGQWRWAADVGPVAAGSLPYRLAEGDNRLFSAMFRSYDWASGNGRDNVGSWIEAAAVQAGR